MSKHNIASQEEAVVKDTAELDCCVTELEKCKDTLEHPAVGAEGDGTSTAVDPATVLAIINVVLSLIKAWRNK